MPGSPACAGDHGFTWNTEPYATHQAAVSRRSCREPPASRRPQQARAQRERGEITAEELKTIEDRAIETVIASRRKRGFVP